MSFLVDLEDKLAHLLAHLKSDFVTAEHKLAIWAHLEKAVDTAKQAVPTSPGTVIVPEPITVVVVPKPPVVEVPVATVVTASPSTPTMSSTSVFGGVQDTPAEVTAGPTETTAPSGAMDTAAAEGGFVTGP